MRAPDELPPAPALAAWLAAEEAGDAAEAEARLAALFGLLEEQAPAPGFADRVAAGLAAEGACAARRRARARQAALAATLTLVALGLPSLPALVSRLDLAAGIGSAVRSLAGLVELLAGGVARWTEWSSLLAPVARLLLHPSLMPLVAALALCSSLALYFLARLVEREKGAPHVATSW